MQLFRFTACIGLLALWGSSTACIDPTEECACTLEYRYLSVKVVDAAGAPVTGLMPTITHVRTGQTIVPKGGSLGGNTYVVLTDGEKDLVRPEGDSIRFEASNGAGVAQADFVMALTEPCDCHVFKLSGPDQIVLQ